MRNDHPVAEAYLQHLHKSIVLIAARHIDDPAPPTPRGTGCLIAYARTDSGMLRPVISTAAHVVEHDPRDATEWTIVRLGDQHRPERVAVFRTPSSPPTGVVDWYCGKWYRGKHDDSGTPSLDIARIEFINDAAPGGFMDESEKLPRVVHAKVGLTAGTRVAWAGFGSVTQSILGRPFLQYYEGVVSAHIDTPDHPPLYLIDGHNDLGLSGSPVWWWNAQSHEAEVAGVITHYASRGKAGYQGLVVASPINPLMAYLEANFRTARPAPSKGDTRT